MCCSRIKVYSPILGWFNDEHYKSLDLNKSFTYICKLSCIIFMRFISFDNTLALYVMTYENYSCINVSRVQQLREVKMDDLYIYNVYTLSLLLAMFQIKQRRGWFCFQQGEDDEDMATLDTTKNIAYTYIFEKYQTLVQIMCEDKGKENDYVLFKKFAHITFGPREVRYQVSHRTQIRALQTYLIQTLTTFASALWIGWIFFCWKAYLVYFPTQ